jgi:hypothetical protein
MTTTETTEPAPGLHIYELPADTNPDSPNRWALAHHEGHVLAMYPTADTATRAATAVAPLADWTRTVMTAANQISFGGNVERFHELLRTSADTDGSSER